MIFHVFCFCSATLLKHVEMLFHLFLSLCSHSLMLCAERKIMKYQLYCLSVDLPGIQPMIFHTQGKHTNPKLFKIIDSNWVLVTVPMGQTTKVDQLIPRGCIGDFFSGMSGYNTETMDHTNV